MLNAKSTYSRSGSGLIIPSVALRSLCLRILNSLLGSLGFESLNDIEPLSKSTL